MSDSLEMTDPSSSPSIHAPRIAFLGVCDALNYVTPTSHTPPETSLIGLKSVVASFLFPLSMNEMFFVFAIYSPLDLPEPEISVRDEDNKEVFRFSFSTHVVPPPSANEALAAPESQEPHPSASPSALLWAPGGETERSWTLLPIQPGPSLPQLLVLRPGLHHLYARYAGQELPIGYLLFLLATAPPLTPDRIAAIKAKPHSAKSVRVRIGCRNCDSAVRAYSALERSPQEEADGWTWHTDLQGTFTCGCGQTRDLDLAYIRDNLHALLGNTLRTGPRVSLTHLYDQASLEVVFERFSRLLESLPQEEAVQLFLEHNPILLYFLSPQRMFFKRPIMADFITDIAVLNPKEELLLIEIERPSLKLLKKDGGLRSEANHAFDQVTEWLRQADDHRAAVLKAFDLVPSDLTAIRGVVVAGRDGPYSPVQLSSLKGPRLANVTFFTYDDLLGNLGILIRELVRLNEPNESQQFPST